VTGWRKDGVAAWTAETAADVGGGGGVGALLAWIKTNPGSMDAGHVAFQL